MGDTDQEDEYLDDDYEDYDDEPLPPPDTVVREERKIGRNDPCPCGSGKKYKKCCLKKGNGKALFDSPTLRACDPRRVFAGALAPETGRGSKRKGMANETTRRPRTPISQKNAS
jgi:hypothetical protein